jgi:hypothetical protein
MRVKIELDERLKQGLTEEQLAKIELARVKIETVVNSLEYTHWCVNFTHKIKVITKRCFGVPKRWHYDTRNVFTSTTLTNKEVLRKIVRGSETLTPGEDEEADIFLRIDWAGSKGVLGHTYPNTIWQWIHGWFFKSGSVDDIAGNLYHEWLHKLGFTHPRKYSLTRLYSVPYQHGYFVRDFTS